MSGSSPAHNGVPHQVSDCVSHYQSRQYDNTNVSHQYQTPTHLEILKKKKSTKSLYIFVFSHYLLEISMNQRWCQVVKE